MTPMPETPRTLVHRRAKARSRHPVVTIAPRFTFERVLRGLAVVGVVAAAAWLLWFFSALFIYLLVGVLLAYLVQPLVTWFEGLGLARIPAIVATFAVVVGVLVLVVRYTVPFVSAQFAALSAQLTVERVRDVLGTLEPRLPLVRPGTLADALERAIVSLTREERLSSMASSVMAVLADVLYAILVVPFVTFFVLRDGPRIRRGMLRLVPNRYFEPTLALVEKVEANLGRYLKGLLAQCLAVATVATIMLHVVGLDNATAVGIFTGLANTIPYFGPLVGLAAGSVVGIVQTGDFTLVPGVFLAMAVTQISDNVLFQPFIFSRAARAHPLFILFVVLIGAQLAGIVGMLVAIPVSTILRVTLQQVLWSFRHYRLLRPA